LLKIPAKVRFLSCEPLLGEVDLSTLRNEHNLGEGQPWLDALGGYVWCCDGPDYVDTCNIEQKIAWAICGGESGPKRRPMELAWIESLAAQCARHKTPFFVKQDTALKPGQQGRLSHELFNTKQFPE
jgi:protein gp37